MYLPDSIKVRMLVLCWSWQHLFWCNSYDWAIHSKPKRRSSFRTFWDYCRTEPSPTTNHTSVPSQLNHEACVVSTIYHEHILIFLTPRSYLGRAIAHAIKVLGLAKSRFECSLFKLYIVPWEVFTSAPYLYNVASLGRHRAPA